MAYSAFNEFRHSLGESLSTLLPTLGYSDASSNNNSSGLMWTEELAEVFAARILEALCPDADAPKSLATQASAPHHYSRNVIQTNVICKKSHVEAPALRLHTVVLRQGKFDTFYQPEFFYTTGGNPPYSYSAEGLPSGIFLDRGGKLSGVARESGTFQVEVRVVDGIGNAISRSYRLTIEAHTNTDNDLQLLPTARLGANYCSPLILSSKDSLSLMLIVQGLPKGLHISQTNIVGVPTEPGNYRIKQTVHYPGANSDCITYDLTVGL